MRLAALPERRVLAWRFSAGLVCLHGKRICSGLFSCGPVLARRGLLFGASLVPVLSTFSGSKLGNEVQDFLSPPSTGSGSKPHGFGSVSLADP